MPDIKGTEDIEISTFDLRYENYRMRSGVTEKTLLTSILEHGIRDPLQGIDTNDSRILLDGFKRYRCARKLNINIVPYQSLSSDEAHGIIELIRIANSKSLSILEQAKLLDELKSIHKMSVSEIASHVEKSKGWVGMRIGIIQEMGESIISKIMNGHFPAYSYMYSLRPFMRMNGVKRKDIERFVTAVSGKNLSTRDIETLSHGYFKGPDEFRQQIHDGNISWGLRCIKEASEEIRACTEIERAMLRDLKVVQKYIERVAYKSRDDKFKTSSFFAQANLLSGGIIKQLESFSKAIREFHDRTG